jgi:hypothetical protein
MPQTSQFGLPYPVLSDTPDVPRDIKALADATDAALAKVNGDVGTTIDQRPLIGAEFQAMKANPNIGGWFQFGNQPAWQSRWDSVWWTSRWPGGAAAIQNGPAGAPGAVEFPYSGIWYITLHFEADLGNSVWIASVDVPGRYPYGNRWAWLWDMRINHGMVTGREYYVAKGDKLSFLAYCREANGRTSGTVGSNVWMRVIARYLGPLEGATTGLPIQVTSMTDPTDPAVTANPLP